MEENLILLRGLRYINIPIQGQISKIIEVIKVTLNIL